jgi:hypothetical protein
MALPMSMSLELSNNWMGGEALEGVLYALNESVEVITELGVSEAGSVITLLEIEPEPKYIVELCNGTDVYALQSAIRKPAT